jgi:hypothetical protein
MRWAREGDRGTVTGLKDEGTVAGLVIQLLSGEYAVLWGDRRPALAAYANLLESEVVVVDGGLIDAFDYDTRPGARDWDAEDGDAEAAALADNEAQNDAAAAAQTSRVLLAEIKAHLWD